MGIQVKGVDHVSDIYKDAPDIDLKENFWFLDSTINDIGGTIVEDPDCWADIFNTVAAIFFPEALIGTIFFGVERNSNIGTVVFEIIKHPPKVDFLAVGVIVLPVGLVQKNKIEEKILQSGPVGA